MTEPMTEPLTASMKDQREHAQTSKAWPFEEARKLLKHLGGKLPAKGYVLFETGYGPSGLPHIGTFGEVARTTMVRRAFEILTGWPTRLICFSDDLDGMRKVPSNVPNPDNLAEYLQMPLSSVPDPFGKYSSFAEHNNAMLRRFLDKFGFDYEFISATDFYKSGDFDAVLLRALDKYEEIMAVMLASLREERRATYSCFLPISPTTGRVLYVPLTRIDKAAGTISFMENGEEVTVSVTGGRVKLQWKPDFGARWAALGVDFEMYGKDHSTNTVIYDKICRILGERAPAHYFYEMFLDEKGEKISKSAGNGISIDEWLSYASAESLSYFMYQKPRTAKRLHFDVIPKAMDEYDAQVRGYAGQDLVEQLANPVFHIHGGDVPKAEEHVVSFDMLLTLAGVALTADEQEIMKNLGMIKEKIEEEKAEEEKTEKEKAEEKRIEKEKADNIAALIKQDEEILWRFIQKYAPEISNETHPKMYKSVGLAVRYFHDFVKPNLKYRLAGNIEYTAMRMLVDALMNIEIAMEIIKDKNIQMGKDDDSFMDWSPDNADDLQSLVFAIGKLHDFKTMRDWFKALYEVLLGTSQGPRFGSLIAIYGVEETAVMIEKTLDNGFSTRDYGFSTTD